MRIRRELVCAFGVALSGFCAHADPVWQNSNYFTETRASAMAESPFDWHTFFDGGNYIGLFPPRDDSYYANVTLPDGGGQSDAQCRLAYSFNGNILSISGSVSADVDPADFMIGGTAYAISTLTVLFDLPEGGAFRITDGSFGGTHASSSGILYGPQVDPFFSFDSISGNQPDGQTGTLPAGGYRLELGATANSDYFFFSGLFADASYNLDIEIIPSSSCPGDLNNDALVDDADFTIFVVAYNLLDCADPAMTAGCPADLNSDGFVDDADFIVFVVAYNELVCP
jgi:hypothetical protein